MSGMVNKNVIIPSILAAAVLVAGIFAFMPVEQASTVHTIILGETTELRTVFQDELLMTAACDNDLIRIDADVPFVLHSVVVADGDLDPGPVGFNELFIDTSTNEIRDTTVGEAEFNPTELMSELRPEGIPATDRVDIRINDAVATCNNDTMDVTIVVRIASTAADPTITVVAG